MHGVKTEQGMPDPENGTTSKEHAASIALAGMVERVRSMTRADGAVIAVSGSRGVVCLASTGNAPAVGSQLQSESAFTRECFETGRVVLCEDSERDPRIQPSIARSLQLRSAVAVPIHGRESVFGVVEVFSNQLAAFDSTHIAELERVADSLSSTLAPEPRLPERQVASGPALVASRVEPVSPAPERPAARPSSLTWPPRRLPQPTNQRRSGAAAVTPVFRVCIEKAKAMRGSLIGVVAVCAVALLLFAVSRPGQIKTSTGAPIPPVSGVAKPSVTAMALGGNARNPSEGESPKGGHPFPQSAATTFSTQSSSPKDEEDKRDGPDARTIGPIAGDRANPRTSNPSPQPEVGSGTVPPDSKQPGPAGHESEGTAAGRTSNIEAKLEPFESPTLRESAKVPILAVTPVIPALLKSTISSAPDFVLDRTLKGHSGWVTGVAFSSDGRRLASGSWDESVKFWDVRTGQAVSTVASKMKEVQALAFSHDGHWLAAENSSDIVTLWDAATGREIRTMASDKPLGILGSNWVYSIAFSPDGRWLASGVDDKTVRIWEVKTGRVVRDLTAQRRSVIYAAFSPDGRWLASGNDDKSIRIWDVFSGQEIARLSGHKKTIYAVAFSPNGRSLASAGADKTIKLWDIATGREIRTLTGHGSVVTSLAFSPDGHWLASGSWDKTIKIWDVESGQQMQSLGGSAHSVYTVAFDSRGQWLASGSEDGTINLWRLGEGVQMRVH